MDQITKYLDLKHDLETTMRCVRVYEELHDHHCANKIKWYENTILKKLEILHSYLPFNAHQDFLPENVKKRDISLYSSLYTRTAIQFYIKQDFLDLLKESL
jgi:hypothetical protein